MNDIPMLVDKDGKPNIQATLFMVRNEMLLRELLKP